MIVIICLTAFAASMLTFFSGFGLGTILLPVMAVFFPIEVAVALTGVVHFLNNIFKFTLVGRFAVLRVVLRFGVPAMLAAYCGARLLFGMPYVRQVVAALMIAFSLFEILPRFKKIRFGLRWMPIGGVLSGFFGGLSGHQGALRSMFLIRAGLGKEAFIATGVVITCAIDVTRLSVYASQFAAHALTREWPLLLAATAGAFAGAFLGNTFLKKITIDVLQTGVAVAIAVFALLLGMGVI